MTHAHSGRQAFFHGLSAVLGVFVAAFPAYSQSPDAEEIGLRIATEARERERGFGNFTARQTMLLRNSQGQESHRELRVKVLEVEGDGNRSLFVFDEPRDVAGTAMLVHGHTDAQDDQWLYLPALTRVKRISSSNRSGSFMGSEFTYEDLGSPEVEKYTYRYLRDEPCGGIGLHGRRALPGGGAIGLPPAGGLARQGRA